MIFLHSVNDLSHLIKPLLTSGLMFSLLQTGRAFLTIRPLCFSTHLPLSAFSNEVNHQTRRGFLTDRDDVNGRRTIYFDR